MTLIDWIGTFGVGGILIAYILSVFRIVSTESLVFIIMNCLGAALAFAASVLLHYVPFMILEAVWTFVSLLALVKHVIKAKNAGRKKPA